MGPVEVHKENIMKVSMPDNQLTIKGRVRLIFEDVKTGEIEISEWIENIIPTVGRTAIARRLRNVRTKSNEGIVTYGAVGTGSSTPANSDIKLATELIRKTIASSSNADNVVTFRIFFTTSEANGTLTEFGLFGEDASVSADSGTLFERVLFSKTKTSAKTLTIESQITIS